MPYTNPTSTPPHRLNRRRQILLAGLASIWLSSCSGMPGTQNNGVVLSVAQLQGALAQQFPKDRRVLELFQMNLSAPTLTLMPQDNRLGTALTLRLKDRVFDTQVSGRLALNYRLRFDATDASVRMSDVEVDLLELQTSSGPLQSQVQRIGAIAVEQVFKNMLVYQLSSDQAQWLIQNKINVKPELTVLDKGVRIDWMR